VGEEIAMGAEPANASTHAVWPSWARRTFYVDGLGEPGLFFARLAICLAFVMIAYVGIWNAKWYPIPLGYDAQGDVNYAHVVLHDHRLPTLAESNEYKQPPGYYALAGIAAQLGHKVFGWSEAKPYNPGFPEPSYRGAEVFNLLCVLGTALIILSLARLVAPDRPSVWAAAVLFFAFLPVVAKTAAMFHPETLNMFLSAVAVWVTTRVLVRRRLDVRHAIAIALLLAAGLLVRSGTLFTLIAIGLALGIVFVVPKIRSPHGWRQVTATAAGVVLVAGGLVAVSRSHVVPHTPDISIAIFHPGFRTAVPTRSEFGHLSTAVFSRPFRPNFINQALPTTYTEIWGDWIGAMSWSPYTVTPTPAALTVMKDQSSIGLLPTALAIGGWLLLLAQSLRRRRELLAVTLLPLIAVTGYLYRSYVLLSPDGDLLKASYLLTTAPVWALGFGVAFGALGRFRHERFGLAACLIVFAILELRFMLYGVRDGRVIF
jgi:hypothetical protein